MNEQDLADRFSRDVDNLLSETGRAEVEPAPDEYRRTLDLARNLATADFSDESQVREALRRSILNQAGARGGWWSGDGVAMRSVFWKRTGAPSLLTILLTTLLVMALAWPEALAAAAEGIAGFVQSIRLGPHTSARQIDPEWAAAHPQNPPPATPEVRYDGDTWIVRTSIGNFAGDLRPGQRTVRRFDAFEEAEAAIGLHPNQLRSLPPSYLLLEAIVTPDNWLFLFYSGPQSEIVLAQVQVYEHVEQTSDQHIVATGVHVGLLIDKPIEEVMLNGRPAGWVEGYGLMWEIDGMSLTLGGPNLAWDEAIRLAKSLE
jgi:hypothetical protein